LNHQSSEPQSVEHLIDVSFDLAGGPLVGGEVGADGVVDVVAIGVEESGSIGHFRDPVDEDFEVVGGHRDDVIGVTDQIRQRPPAGVAVE
jgi:hypothetical protein